MTHGFEKGIWKDYLAGMTKLMEDQGNTFPSFEDVMEEEGANSPWDDFGYTPEEYYLDCVHGFNVMDAYQNDIESFWLAGCYAADFAMTGSLYTVIKDEEKRTITVKESSRTILTAVFKDTEAIDVQMPEDIYKALKVYPEVVDDYTNKEGLVFCNGACLDDLATVLMAVAGKIKELMDCCD